MSLLRRLLGPTLTVLRENWPLLRQAAWMRVRHPHLWREARRECLRDQLWPDATKPVTVLGDGWPVEGPDLDEIRRVAATYEARYPGSTASCPEERL